MAKRQVVLLWFTIVKIPMVQLWSQFRVNRPRRTTIFKLSLMQQRWTSMVFTVMHTHSAERGIATLLLSVLYCNAEVLWQYIGWVPRKQLHIHSLESSNYGARDRQSCRRGTPKFRLEYGWGSCFQQKTCKISETKRGRTMVAVDH